MHRLAILLLLMSGARPALAAVGCTLNDPDRDIRRVFPTATGYRTDFVTIQELGGEALARDIEEKMGDKLDPVYEALDVPYAFYAVLNGTNVIGRVHGVNQKGKYGGMQLILATDLDDRIVAFYYQKISSPEAKRFRDPGFLGQFKGAMLADFADYRRLPEPERAASRIGGIKDPTEKSAEDFKATLRGLMKNLILLELFEKGGKP